jgi:hypothetical protein
MVSFQTKNNNLGKFWWALVWIMLIYFMAIWNSLQAFGIFYDHIGTFVFIWYIFPVLVSSTKKIWQILTSSSCTTSRALTKPMVWARVARWYICIPKFLYFGGPLIGKILWTFGIFYGHLVYFMDIWYILWTFGIFYGHLVYLMDIWYILCAFGIFNGRFGMLFQEKIWL